MEREQELLKEIERLKRKNCAVPDCYYGDELLACQRCGKRYCHRHTSLNNNYNPYNLEFNCCQM